jgi:uncharacterized membrane protein YjjB (DUF3815 family)
MVCIETIVTAGAIAFGIMLVSAVFHLQQNGKREIFKRALKRGSFFYFYENL